MADVIFAKPKSKTFTVAVRSNLHVGWFQVAMDDTECMCLVQGLDDLTSEAPRLFERERAIRDPLRQRRPLDQFHGDKGLAVDRTNLVDRADAGMIHAGRMLRFAAESRERLGVAVDRDFQGHLSAQFHIARCVHVTHATDADAAADLITTDQTAGQQSICCRASGRHRCDRRLFNEGSSARVRQEEAIDFGAQFGISVSGALPRQIRLPIRGRHVEARVEQRFDTRPAFWSHGQRQLRIRVRLICPKDRIRPHPFTRKRATNSLNAH
jgi:hypothetical protein